jgi:hypothetical protein
MFAALNTRFQIKLYNVSRFDSQLILKLNQSVASIFHYLIILLGRFAFSAARFILK